MTEPAPRPQIRELTPGDHEVTHEGGTSRVLVPAGVGVPGLEEGDLVALVVDLVREHDRALPAVVDVSLLLGTRPELRAELERRAEELE
jgi:hypothetical protein